MVVVQSLPVYFLQQTSIAVAALFLGASKHTDKALQLMAM